MLFWRFTWRGLPASVDKNIFYYIVHCKAANLRCSVFTVAPKPLRSASHKSFGWNWLNGGAHIYSLFEVCQTTNLQMFARQCRQVRRGKASITNELFQTCQSRVICGRENLPTLYPSCGLWAFIKDRSYITHWETEKTTPHKKGSSVLFLKDWINICWIVSPL